jgi:methyl-accepting chemotaxis protein
MDLNIQKRKHGFSFVVFYIWIFSFGIGTGIVFFYLLHIKNLKNWVSLGMCIFVGILFAFLILEIVQVFFLKHLRYFSESIRKLSNNSDAMNQSRNQSRNFLELLIDFDVLFGYLNASLSQLKLTSDETLSLAKQLTQTIQQMHSATEEVSETVQNISKGAEDQVQKVQEAFSIIDHMAGSIQNSTEQLKSSEKVISHARGATDSGKQAVQKAIAQMKSIYDVVQSSSKEVNELGSRSMAIGQVVDVITNIADQTNLLALNAAIEAARAGEAGQGFAVVADEVKKLADGSSAAASRIGHMVRDIQKEIIQVVQSMNIGAEKVSDGMTIVGKAGDALSEIYSSTEEVIRQVQNISVAFENQAEQAGKVVEAITNIVAVSEENAAATEQISASTEELTASMESVLAAARQLEGVAQRLTNSSIIFKKNTRL